jgi:alpha-lytic protease prodomain-containing protein/trypsin
MYANLTLLTDSTGGPFPTVRTGNMVMIRITGRVTAGFAGLIVGALLTGQSASAKEVDAAVSTGMRTDSARAIAGRLGGARTAGVYVDAQGQVVVTVTDEAAAATVRASGGVAQIVSRSADYLNAVTATLDRSAVIPGTSWGVDPRTNQVSVEYDGAVTDVDLARLTSVTGRYGAAVRVEKVPGRLRPTAGSTAGGMAIQTAGTQEWTCSLGFNVRSKTTGVRYFLTAGHCAAHSSDWERGSDGEYLGRVESYSYPGNDYAAVRYNADNVTAYGTILLNGEQKQISSSGNPTDGESVQRVGTKSVDLVGQVLQTSTTVNYDDGSRLTGMIKTSLCAKEGDSGGPLFDGTVALGITSGGTMLDQPCNSSVSDRRSYYQPVQEALDHYGFEVY